MTTKKRSKKASSPKRKPHKYRSSTTARKRIEKEPEFMVQLSEPKMLRKDILESLREVIIFMQGYETFRRVQDEKVMLFARLKSQVKELNSLIDSKLRAYMPKGKLRSVVSKPMPEPIEEEENEQIPESRDEQTPTMPSARDSPQMPQDESAHELDRLENQLQDIESQLQNLK